jgi:magnesium transporter
VANSLLPFGRWRWDIAAACASAPLVAMLGDGSGLVISFTIASLVLRGTLVS